MLQAFSDPGRFWRGNIHGHSDISDGILTPQEVCEAYRQAGYDFIAITDHFRAKDGFRIADTRPYRDASFTTIIGAEVHAPATSRGVDWHILAVGLPLDFSAPEPAETGVELARRCAEAGAFVAIAHPQWYQLTLEDGLSLDAAHAVEVYNHISAVNSDRGDGMVLHEAMLSEGRKTFAIAVDDSHWKVKDAFGGWVMVKAQENTPEALLAGLKAGAFYSSQGPQFLDIRRKGNTLEIETTPADAILVIGPVSAGVRLNGSNLTSASVPLDKFTGAWCRVVVIDAKGKRAWSNPLWLTD